MNTPKKLSEAKSTHSEEIIPLVNNSIKHMNEKLREFLNPHISSVSPEDAQEVEKIADLIQRTKMTYSEYQGEITEEKKSAIDNMIADNSAAAFTDKIRRKQNTYVYKEDEKIIGTVSVGKGESSTGIARDNFLMNLFADSASGRRGVGTELTTHIENIVRENGHHYLLVPCRNNLKTLLFYVGMGYLIIEPWENWQKIQQELFNEANINKEYPSEDKEAHEKVLLKIQKLKGSLPASEDAYNKLYFSHINEYQRAEKREIFTFEKNVIRMWKALR